MKPILTALFLGAAAFIGCAFTVIHGPVAASGSYFSPVFSSSGTSGGVSTSATSYGMFSGTSAFSNTEAKTTVSATSAMTVSDARVIVSNSPGTGKSWTFTLRKNGADTALTVTISDDAVSGSSSESVSIAAGDKLNWSVVPSATPNALTSGPQISCTSKYDVPGAGIFFGSVSAMGATTSTKYNGPSYTTYDATDALGSAIMPTGGTLSNLYVTLEGSPGTSKSYAFTVYKNGSPTALTVSITNSATTQSDTTNTVTYSAGDTISLQVTPTGTPTNRAMRAACFFAPAINGESPFFGRLSAPSTTVANYGRVPLSTDTPETSALSSIAGVIPRSYYARKLYNDLTTAPGTGKSRTSLLYVNSGDTALSCAVADTATSGSDASNSVSVVDGDLIYIKSTPSSTPAATTYLKTSLVLYGQ